MAPPLMRRASDFRSSAWGMLSKYPLRSASTTWQCPDCNSVWTWLTRLGFRLCDQTAAAFPMMSVGRLPH